MAAGLRLPERRPAGMTARPLAEGDCSSVGQPGGGVAVIPGADTSPRTKKPDYRIYFDIRSPRRTIDVPIKSCARITVIRRY